MVQTPAFKLISLTLLTILVYAKVANALDAPQLTESVYFSQAQSYTFSDWVRSGPLTPSHRKNIEAYLRGHHLEKTRLPAVRWTYGTTVFTVGKAPSAVHVDFSQLQSTHKLLVDGVPRGDATVPYFSDVVESFKRHAPKPSRNAGHAHLFEAEAHAETFDDLEYEVYEAMCSWTGLDALTACQGNENISTGLCQAHDVTNGEMILRDLKATGHALNSFTCDGALFKSFSFEDNNGAYFLSETRDAKGRLASVVTARNGVVNCRYEVSNDLLTKITAAPDPLLENEGCTGRNLNEYESRTGNFVDLKVGGHVKIIDPSPVPLQRLGNCCQYPACVATVRSGVVKARPVQPAGSSAF